MSELDDMIQYIPDEEEEECKMERSFDNYEMGVTCAGVKECKEDIPTVDLVYSVPVLVRTLDAIYQHDDGDEAKSLIWVQCRICKWSLPVDSYVDGHCLCNWDQKAALEEEMARLSYYRHHFWMTLMMCQYTRHLKNWSSHIPTQQTVNQVEIRRMNYHH